MLNFLPTSPLFLSGTATIHLLPNDKFICVKINLVKRCRWLNRSRGHMISLENSTSCSYILFVFVSIKDYTLTYCLSFEKYSLKICSSDCKIEYNKQTAQSIFPEKSVTAQDVVLSWIGIVRSFLWAMHIKDTFTYEIANRRNVEPLVKPLNFQVF